MLNRLAIAGGLLLAFTACKKDRDERPTAAQREAVATAEADKQHAEAEKRQADQALEAAKQREKEASAHAEKAKDWAEDVRDKADLDDDFKADRDRDHVAARDADDGIGNEWTRFAAGRDRTVERGGYTLERGPDGSITTYRRTKPVAATVERSDGDIERDVKARLASERDANGKELSVDVDDHVVTLRGSVIGADDASRAVRRALSVPGVDKVVSHLSFRAAK